jgi:hypothetical protein
MLGYPWLPTASKTLQQLGGVGLVLLYCCVCSLQALHPRRQSCLHCYTVDGLLLAPGP